MRRSCVLLFLVLLAAALRADVTLAPLFRDGAVLQRDRPLPIWGRAEPNEAVRVRWGGQTRETTAAPDGRWSITLAPQPASARPAVLEVSGRNTVRVSNILVGDVWLCSGQSNMNWNVKDARNGEQEIATANHPLIRYFGVTNEVAEAPRDDTPGSWEMVAPGKIGAFSAVAYFFARELQAHIGVPVGIIKATPGGSGIEAWMRADSLPNDRDWAEILAHRRKALADFPAKEVAYTAALAEWNRRADAAKQAGTAFTEKKPAVPEGPLSRNAPGGLYNSSIHPLVPYALTGILWYQGEANASRFQVYRKLLPALITQWRTEFHRLDLPFLIVQLANFELANDPTHQQWAFQREAQASALSIPQTAMAVTIDIGEAATIHPLNKQEVGRRLALLARAHVYGQAVAADSPRAVQFTVAAGSIRVKFSDADGLVARGQIADLEIAGADRKFHPAVGRLEDDSLVVSSPTVPEPVAVRYLWRNAPEATLYNRAGLPVAPFRSDNW
jgi:sialate O-acetylesterase